MLLLLADAVVLIVSLSELSWRRTHTENVLLPGVFGLLNNVLGACAALKRSPGGLGLFAILALVQLLVGAMMLTSLMQLAHLGMLPYVAYTGIMLRRTALPLWFGTSGRAGR